MYVFLFTALYGLINSNAKWQVLGDTIITDISFRQTPVLLQLFVRIRNNKLVYIISKIIDDFVLVGSPAVTDLVIISIAAKLEFGTIVHNPSHLRYFGLILHHNDHFSTVFALEDKLAK